VTEDEALELLEPAVAGRGGVWADLGAGEGTFTRALAALLEPGAHVYAVDRDERAVAALREWARSAPCKVDPVMGDFTSEFEPPKNALLDGMVFANSLHYVADAGTVLARLVAWVKPGGRIVVVEYDRRSRNRWVPYPIPITKLPALAAAAGLTSPSVVARRPSMYEGELYVAVMDRPDASA
jgi:SAM-dependent methyltransferase